SRPVCLNEGRAMLRLLLLHFVEYGGGRRIRVAQPVSKVTVDPSVLLLEGDRQREHLGLRQIIKVSGHQLSEVVGLLIALDNIPKARTDMERRKAWRMHTNPNAPEAWTFLLRRDVADRVHAPHIVGDVLQ